MWNFLETINFFQKYIVLYTKSPIIYLFDGKSTWRHKQSQIYIMQNLRWYLDRGLLYLQWSKWIDPWYITYSAFFANYIYTCKWNNLHVNLYITRLISHTQYSNNIDQLLPTPIYFSRLPNFLASLFLFMIPHPQMVMN